MLSAEKLLAIIKLIVFSSYYNYHFLNSMAFYARVATSYIPPKVATEAGYEYQ